MNTKTILADVEIKSEAKGTVRAVVATLNRVDHDRDVILTGAIRDGSRVKLSAFGHDAITEGKPPVGIGTVSVVGNEAVLDGRYFLSSDRGREAFSIVRELGPEGEWSIGFAVLDSQPPTDAWRAKGAQRMLTKLDLWEASAVLRGASPGTRTLAAKHDARRSLTADQQRDIQAAAAHFAELSAKMQQGEDLATIHRRWTHPESIGTDCYDRYSRLIDWVCSRHLGIPFKSRPRIYHVPRAAIGPGVAGKYYGPSHCIGIADDLTPDEATRTVAHELVHAWQKLNGKAMSEDFAAQMEHELFAEWQTVRHYSHAA